jgi:hypothetical protein
MRGNDELDDKLLKEMAEEADRYVRSFAWCIEIHDKYFGDGYGGIVALFLFRVTIRGLSVPEWIWAIVGDIPPCYLEVEGFPNAQAALSRYIEGVEDWMATSERERALREDLPPIEMLPGEEFIEMLKSRTATLREHILPHFKTQ